MMTIAERLLQVRQRANFACEFCGVTEIDSGGEWTTSADHFRPLSRGGTDHIDNLVYCCVRCNQYKAAYWPNTPHDPMLWNPRLEPMGMHFVRLVNGMLHPITPTGAFSLKRLRLNRSPLISYRKSKLFDAEEKRLLARFGSVILTGRIVEDRGKIGIGGRRLLRVHFDIDGDQKTLELPEEELILM